MRNKLKVLNLFGGIGGNRRLWKNVDVTMVELDAQIAALYQDLYPNDKVIVTDAHQYLLEYYKDFDFVWSSPPCQSHSKMRQFVGVKAKGYKSLFPDFRLYEEIVFLQNNVDCFWAVENVLPYYKVLIEPTIQIGRHLFWSNFPIKSLEVKTQNLRSRNKISEVEELHQIDLSNYKITNKRQLLRNCVDSNLGKHILDSLPI